MCHKSGVDTSKNRISGFPYCKAALTDRFVTVAVPENTAAGTSFIFRKPVLGGEIALHQNLRMDLYDIPLRVMPIGQVIQQNIGSAVSLLEDFFID